jgi:hypothetical protein
VQCRPDVRTLQDWAGELFCTKDYISGVETGHHWPSRDFVERYQSACRIDTGELVALYDQLTGPRRRPDPAPATPPVELPVARGTRRRLVRVGTAGAAVVAAGVGLLALALARTGNERPRVTVASPRPGASVCYAESVEGRWAGLSPGTDLWLVVRPLQDPLHYPQPGPLVRTDTGSGHRWTGKAYFGEENRGVGDEFQLEVISATPAASTRLSAEHSAHAGLPQLPPGTVVRAALVVRRAC